MSSSQDRDLTEARVEHYVYELLKCIGDDADREGLEDTPARVARMYKQIFRALTEDPPKLTTFSNTDHYDQMIVLSGIPVFSMCEHHILPFFGEAHIGYVPSDKLVGLSKIARTVDYFAAKPQVQERLTHEVSQYVLSQLNPKASVVVFECQHLCMSMRGVQKPGVVTTTSAIFGDPNIDEFFSIVRNRQ